MQDGGGGGEIVLTQEEIDRLDYESAVKALEQVVSELAREPDDLARSVRTYEEGLALARRCAQILKEAEQRLRETPMPDRALRP